MNEEPTTPPLLAGLKVLCVSEHDAGALVAALLADLGAEVVRVTNLVVPRASPLAFLFRGQTLRRCNPAERADLARLHDWATQSDLLVTDDSAGARFGTALSYAELRAANPRLVELHLPGFAPDSPWRDSPATEVAFAGVGGLQGLPGRSRDQTTFAVATLAGSLFGVVSALAACLVVANGGRGQRVEMPLADAAPSLLELTWRLSQPDLGLGDGLRWAASPATGTYRTSDDQWLYVHAGLSSHWQRLLRVLALEAPEVEKRLAAACPHFMQDPLLTRGPGEVRRVRSLLEQAFRQHTAHHWQRILNGEGVSAATVQSLSTWLHSSEALASGATVQVAGTVQPAPLVQVLQADGGLDEAPSSRRVHRRIDGSGGSDVRSAPLAGIRVLDLSRIIAGPTAGRALAALGAEVVKVVDPTFSPAFLPAFQTVFDRGKQLVELHLRSPSDQARLWRLAQDFSPSILLDNFRPSAAASLGLTPPELKRRLPGVLHVRVTAYGSRSHLAAWGGWEQSAQALTGMQDALGAGGRPCLLPLPANDFCTGLTAAAAAIAGLWRSARGQSTPSLEVALARTALWMQLPGLGESPDPKPMAAEPPPSALAGIYRCRHGRLALTPQATANVGELAAALGLEPGSTARQSLRAEIAVALRTRPAQQWLRVLTRSGATHGFAALPIRSLRQVFRDPDLRRRGLLRTHHGAGGRPTELAEWPARFELATTHTLRPGHGLELKLTWPRQALNWLRRAGLLRAALRNA